MVYLNFDRLIKTGYSYLDYLALVAAKQSKNRDQSEHLREMSKSTSLINLQEKGLISLIKGRESDPIFKKVRLTKKGLKFLEDLSLPSVEEEDTLVWDWLATYFKKIGKDVGNSNKGQIYVSCFRNATGISKNELIFLCRKYINSEDAMQYSIRLDYVFFKPPSVYQTRFDIGESKLYRFYIKHEEFFTNYFKTKNLNKNDSAT